jgi:aspartate ammonia-lyase
MTGARPERRPMDERTEHDTLGDVRVPASAYYGAQTARAVENFPVSGLRADPHLLRAYFLIKKAAAAVNGRAGALAAPVAQAIAAACDEALAGRFDGEFPVDVYQAGAGTSLHMNVNEVLANRAQEILGGARGLYDRVHPNDHVNRGQSTNDTFPTAMRLAILLALPDLLAATEEVAAAFDERASVYADRLKAGRTHLQDAVPVTLGQELAAYAAALRRSGRVLEEAAAGLRDLPLGGTATGTGLNAAPGFREAAIALLAEWTTLPLVPGADLREGMQSQQPVGVFSGALRALALELIRIANDLRLLASGPATGLGEIALPAVQPGSSIMPGKVNPVMAECLDMIAFQVIGNDAAVALAVQAGQLELNVMMPVMIHNVLFSVRILTRYLPVFARRCVRGIEADDVRCEYWLDRDPAVVTALNPVIGYERAAAVVKESAATGRGVREILRSAGILSEEEIARLLSPENLAHPGRGEAGR